MASNRIRNAAPRKGLRVRVPCPPLSDTRDVVTIEFVTGYGGVLD